MEAVATRTVSPNRAKKSITRAFKKKRPIFLWGPPGIGKSDIVHQIGYGMDAYRIDGNNILEVHSTISKLAEEIKENPKPILLTKSPML